MTFVTIASLLMLQKTGGVVLECEFKDLYTQYGSFYTCIAKNFRTELNDRTVTEIKGNHRTGMSNDDVKMFYMKKQPCPYLPLKAGSYFPNLEAIYFIKSNIQHLLSGDLDGLTKLKIFDIQQNPVEVLGRDFFQGQDKIKQISFLDCHLRFIDVEALEPLVNLVDANFRTNKCIDRETGYANTLQGIKNVISNNCQTTHFHEDMLKRKDENLVCPGYYRGNQKTSFSQRNVYVIMTLMTILSIFVSLVLVKIAKNRFNGNWNELRNTLF